VALLRWPGATLHDGVRDRYIGWDDACRRARLHLVVNNARFLILPWVRQPNLASRVLGANLQRLSADWQAAYGHPMLVAETFVDQARFQRTCYRAGNWICVGQTKGWSRHGASYYVLTVKDNQPTSTKGAATAGSVGERGILHRLRGVGSRTPVAASIRKPRNTAELPRKYRCSWPSRAAMCLPSGLAPRQFRTLSEALVGSLTSIATLNIRVQTLCLRACGEQDRRSDP